MGYRITGTRVVRVALVVLSGLGASSSLAGDGTTGELGPIRQWVAQRDGLPAVADVKIGPVRAWRGPLAGRNHAREGAIAGAVVGGALVGLYGAAMGAWACEGSQGRCDEALVAGAVGAAGGALVGGAVGGLVGSLFQTEPSAAPRSSRARTRVRIVPRRRGVGIALAHSF